MPEALSLGINGLGITRCSESTKSLQTTRRAASCKSLDLYHEYQAPVAQRIEQQVSTLQVEGSNPSGRAHKDALPYSQRLRVQAFNI